MTSDAVDGESRIPAWARGPAELFRHAEDHFHKTTDTDRRLALIGFDNAIEVCVDAFVGLHPRHRNGYQISRADRERILQNFHSKVEFLESFLAEHSLSLGSASFNDVIWYHLLRNQLYHSGNGMTPEREHIVEVREAARAVFRALFGAEVLPPVAPMQSEPPTSPPRDSSDAPDLGFLAAYIQFEKALGHWAGFTQGRAQVSVFWSRFREAHAWAHSYDALVRRARELRNDFAHGRPRSDEPAEVRRMSALLHDLSERVLHESRARTSSARGGLRGRALAERLWALARDIDTDREGMSVADMLDFLGSEGVLVAGDDPARVTYDSLKTAQDLFARAGAAFVWKEAEGSEEGLSGSTLLPLIRDICLWINEVPAGRHYYDILHRLTDGGVAVMGPNQAATVNRVLAEGTKAGLFDRVSPGTYRCRTSHHALEGR